MYKNYKIFIILTLFFPLFLYSENNTIDDLSNLTIEELMNIEVYSTTKSKINIRKSPGVVRVITENDIEKYSFKTLNDILATIPGIQMVRTYKGHRTIWVRGVQTRYNSKVLLLIDGVPIRGLHYGHFDGDFGLTLGNVKRVEVINGPGSVLYGANAFSGIINITTKSKGRSVRGDYTLKKGYSYDSNDDPDNPNSKNQLAHMAGLALEGDIWNFYGYGELIGGNDFTPERNRRGEFYEHDSSTKKRYLMAKYMDDNLMVIGSYNQIILPSVYAKDNRDTFYNRIPLYGTVKYNKDLEKYGIFNIQTYYQYYYFATDSTYYAGDMPTSTDGVIEGVKEGEKHSKLYGTDIDYSCNIFKGNEVKIGFSFQGDESVNRSRDRDSVEGFPDTWGDWDLELSKDVRRKTFGMFIQDLWEIYDNFIFTIGLRYDYLADFDNQFNYRIGLTGQLKSNIYGKVLFGTAYRVPIYREYLKTGVENYNMQPEKMDTFETQIGWLFSKADINLTYYYNHYTNFIDEISITHLRGVDLDGADEYYMNFKKRDIMGVELSSVYNPVKEVNLVLSGAVILKAIEEMGAIPDDVILDPDRNYNTDKQDINFLSKYTVNFLASYRFFEKYEVGSNFHFASKRSVSEEYYEDSDLHSDILDNPDEFVNNTDAYYQLDFFASAMIIDGVKIYAGIRNITDNRIYDPNEAKISEYDVEHSGRYYECRVKYIF